MWGAGAWLVVAVVSKCVVSSLGPKTAPAGGKREGTPLGPPRTLGRGPRRQQWGVAAQKGRRCSPPHERAARSERDSGPRSGMTTPAGEGTKVYLVE